MEENNEDFEYIFNSKMKKKYIKFLKNLLIKNKIFEEQYEILVKLLDEKIKNKNFKKTPNDILYNYIKEGEKNKNEEYLSRLEIIFNKFMTFDKSNELIKKILKNKSKKNLIELEKEIYQNINENYYDSRKELNFKCKKFDYVIPEIFKKMEFIQESLKNQEEGIKNKKILIVINEDKYLDIFKKYFEEINIDKNNIHFYNIKDNKNKLLNFENNFDSIICYFSLSKFNNINKNLKELSNLLNNDGLMIIVDNDIFNLEDYYVCEFLEKLKEPNKKIEKINPLCLLDIEFLLKDLNLYHIETRPLNNFLRQYPKSIYRFISFYIKNKK